MPPPHSRQSRRQDLPMSSFLDPADSYRAWNTTSTPDRLGRLAASGLPDSSQARPDSNFARVSSSTYSTTGQTDAATILAATPSARKQDLDTLSLPSLSRDSSHESEASSTWAQDVAMPARPLLFNPFTGERDSDGDMLMTASVALLCPFRYKGCDFVTHEATQWCSHTYPHFRDHHTDPPRRMVCKACPDFEPQNWEHFMLHMANVHFGTTDKPSLLGEPKTDLIFIHYLWSKGIIDDAGKKELMANPVGPLSDAPITTTARVRERKITRESGRAGVRVRDW